MKTIIAKPYAEAQMQRRALIERGVPPWRVTACSTANLNDLEAEYQQLTLVPDVGRPALTVVEGGREYPETPDEAFSTAFFKARMRGEDPDLPLWFGSNDPLGAA